MSASAANMTPDSIKPQEARIGSYPAAELAGLYGARIKLAAIPLPTGFPDGSVAPEETDILLEHFRLPSLDPKDLVNRKFCIPELTRDTRYEGSIYLQGEHHWVVLRSLSFGSQTKGGITAHYELEFDLYFCRPERFTKTFTIDTRLEDRTVK
jgi:hypothetical protein